MRKPILRFIRALPFILPNFVGFLIFTAGAVVASFYISLTHWDMLSPSRFVGLRNYQELLGFHRDSGAIVPNDPNFWRACLNTIVLMLGIPVSIFGSLIIAILLNQKLRFEKLFRLVFFLPSIVSGVAIMILWKWMFNADYGLINHILWNLFGIVGPTWLSSNLWAKPALMIMGLWCAVGGQNMIIYLAALQGISRELYEAADIDGATSWHKFTRITWPMLQPATFFILTMSIIGGFQAGFDAAYVMTGGGPAGSTITISYFIYIHAYQLLHMGYAAAVSWVLFGIVFLFTLIHWRINGKQAV